MIAPAPTRILRTVQISVCRVLATTTVLLAATAGAQAQSYTVMPLGDSITAGTSVGGYRTNMAQTFANDGHSFYFYGTQVTTASGGTSVPPILSANNGAGLHHEGHGGFTIGQINGDLDGLTYSDPTTQGGYWLTGGNGQNGTPNRAAVYPQFITLLVGINDIDANYGQHQTAGTVMSDAELMPQLESSMTSLVNKITTLRPQTDLMLSNLTPYVNGFLDANVAGDSTFASQVPVAGPAAQDVRVNHYVLRLNTWLKDSFIPAEQAAGKHVYFVDQYSNFIKPDGSVQPYYSDYGLHPNQTGYDLMGRNLGEGHRSGCA